MNNSKNTEKDLKNGLYDNNPLKELVLSYEEEIKKLKLVINFLKNNPFEEKKNA